MLTKKHKHSEITKERPYTGFEELEVEKGVNYEKLARKDEKYRAIFANQLLQLFENRGGNALLQTGLDGQKFEWTREGVNAYLGQLVKNGSLTHQMAGELNAEISKIGYETKQQELYEGVNMHGVHPEIFETEKNKKTGLWGISGEADYNAAQDFAFGKLDGILNDQNSQEYKEIQKRSVRMKDGKLVSVSEDEKQEIQADVRAKLMGKLMKEFAHKHGQYYSKYKTELDNLTFVDSEGITHKFNNHNFHNYYGWNRSMAQRNSNITKSKSAAATLQDQHWNSIWEEKNGIVRLQKSAVVALFDVREDKLFQAGRGVQEKVLKGMIEAVKREDVLLQDFEDKIIEDYRESGINTNNLTKEQKETIRKKALKKVIGIKAIIESAKNGQPAGKAFLTKELAKNNLKQDDEIVEKTDDEKATDEARKEAERIEKEYKQAVIEQVRLAKANSNKDKNS
jgi:hypothetical protein